MSHEATAWAWEQARAHADLGALDRLVLLALADHADQTGRCNPSIARIRESTGISDRGVRRSLAALRDAGLVEWTRTATSSTYALHTGGVE